MCHIAVCVHSVMTTIYRDNCKLYAQANMLSRKFHMCTDDVKIALFKAYCSPLYTAHLWCSYSAGKYRKLRVAYNDALRILLRLPRWTSASHLFVNSGVPTLGAVLRNLMYSFIKRLNKSNNEIIMTLTMPERSSIRYSSCFWKHWRESLYVF